MDDDISLSKSGVNWSTTFAQASLAVKLSGANGCNVMGGKQFVHKQMQQVTKTNRSFPFLLSPTTGWSEGVTVVAVCITATCSYISGEVHIRLWCRVRHRVRHRVRSYAVSTA